MKRTSHKRLTLERERVRTLVVELSPEELRRAAGGLTSNTTTNEEEECEELRSPSGRRCDHVPTELTARRTND